MDATTSLHISLPKALKTYVKRRVEERQYSNPSDYVRTLIREDQVRRDEELLERMLLEGLASGKGEPMTDEDWKTLRREVHTGISNRARRV